MTDATGAGPPVPPIGVTVMVALPLCVLCDAVITAWPCAIPLTQPESETVATAALLDDHVTDRLSGLPRRSYTAACAWVESPTAMLLSANVTTIDPIIRFASADKSSVLRLSGDVASEHDRIPRIANAVVAPRVIRRFTVAPMNRASGFSQVEQPTVTRWRPITANHSVAVLATSNAEGRRAIYVRQARRSYRHCVFSVEFF